ATSVTEPSKGIPGAGFTTLYYGISKKDAQASDETDNVTPLFFASKNNEPIAY
ncbi:hypothetical protein HYV11_03985, partial [Candidatus Dependentiae bacterium]|nr:hypothetical protein [Candidatus Dependentiae bacterium]